MADLTRKIDVVNHTRAENGIKISYTCWYYSEVTWLCYASQTEYKTQYPLGLHV